MSDTPHIPEEAVEALADELMLFRYGGHLVEGRYYVHLPSGKQEIRRPTAVDNARRILGEDRLGLRASIEAELRERLLGDDAVDAAARAALQVLSANPRATVTGVAQATIEAALDVATQKPDAPDEWPGDDDPPDPL